MTSSPVLDHREITNEKKGIFSFYSCNVNKISVRAFSITVDLMFRLKVLMINKRKDKHHNCILNIEKFFIRFDTLFLANFCIFSERGCQFTP